MNTYLSPIILPSEKWGNRFEDYFYIEGLSEKLGIRRFKPLPSGYLTVNPAKKVLHSTANKVKDIALKALKFLSYLTVVIPLAMLFARQVYRDYNSDLFCHFSHTLNNGYGAICPVDVRGTIEKEIGGGWHDAYRVRTPTGQLLFLKKMNLQAYDELPNLTREVAGSSLASYLTGGRVPRAQFARFDGEIWLSQPFVEMDQKPFETLGFDQEVEAMEEEEVEALDLDFSFLTEKQAHQLFVHLLADRIISNWDTHKMQFGIDSKGNIIGIDKGNAFRSIYLDGVPDDYKKKSSEYLHKLDLDQNHWVHPQKNMAKWGIHLINSSFFRQVKSGKIQIDLNHPEVQSFFKRCNSITKAQTKILIEDFYKCIPRHERDAFLDLIHRRIKHIESAVQSALQAPDAKAELSSPWY